MRQKICLEIDENDCIVSRFETILVRDVRNDKYTRCAGEKLTDMVLRKGYDGIVYVNPMRIPLYSIVSWLREERLLHIHAEYKCFCDGIKRNPKPYYHWVPFIKPLPHCKYQILTSYLNNGLDEHCDTYEEACEKAIEYALDKIL